MDTESINQINKTVYKKYSPQYKVVSSIIFAFTFFMFMIIFYIRRPKCVYSNHKMNHYLVFLYSIAGAGLLTALYIILM